MKRRRGCGTGRSRSGDPQHGCGEPGGGAGEEGPSSALERRRVVAQRRDAGAAEVGERRLDADAYSQRGPVRALPQAETPPRRRGCRLRLQRPRRTLAAGLRSGRQLRTQRRATPPCPAGRGHSGLFINKVSRDVDEGRGLDFGFSLSLSEVACRLGDLEGIRSQRLELVSADRPVARLGVRVRVRVRVGLGLEVRVRVGLGLG